MEQTFSRKQILGLGGATIAALASSSVFGEDHSSKKHSKKMKKSNAMPVGSAAEASTQCILKGKICINMCVDALSEGHTEMADCLRSVEETIALCEAFVTLSSLQSQATKKLASLCIESCERCATQCDKHADHHQECKDCAEACKTCISEFKKLLAA
ncbi:four-helix bundle copper-binding protein [Leptospira langatensis]|uniref:Four-helix bundle copper-binding protein n=1 Tax=Leptospira langatensis TaxID=2484983 RepID=A0A5F1ZYW2_9LEPT|nr:four-helix bundle copper-binding protein [Leptospira langatensis]TGJ98525.1 four-helix bundle copper-binding protein [Leptospira langatensis]TGL43440.1 four-helix bundle copper-binding protein [Leptospira langatensis]